MATKKIPLTSAANCFVDAAEVFSPVTRKTWDGKFIPTGVSAKVELESQLHGVGFRFETLSDADCEKALAVVKAAGFKAQIGPGAWVTDHNVPAIGLVGSHKFVYLGDNLLALAPQWVLLENSVLRPGFVGQDFNDIVFYFSKIHPGRLNEVEAA